MVEQEEDSEDDPETMRLEIARQSNADGYTEQYDVRECNSDPFPIHLPEADEPLPPIRGLEGCANRKRSGIRRIESTPVGHRRRCNDRDRHPVVRKESSDLHAISARQKLHYGAI